MTEELIQSRKIATKSLSRHFVPWKPRYFRIDRETFELIVTSVVNSNSNFTDTNRASNSSVGNNDVKVNVVNTVNSNDVTQESHTANSNSNTLVVPISHSSFQIKHHYYSKDWKFLLSLKFSYYRNSSGKDSNSGKHSVCRQGAEMEISMKCESIEQLTRWIRVSSKQ